MPPRSRPRKPPRSEPSLLLRPRGVASLELAAECIELYEAYRHPLDDSQKTTIELALAQKNNGLWAAKTVCRAMPRQAGKGDEIEAVEFYGLAIRGEAIVHTAHELSTSKSAHKRLVSLFESNPDLRRRIKQVRYANGDQSIELTNGGIIVYRTRTTGGGRGLDDISRLIVDEAQHAQPEQLASLTPIQAVNPNPQTMMAGTGGIAGKSEWWWEQRLRALRGDNADFAWHEHTAEQIELNADGDPESIAPDPEDRDSWYRTHTGFSAGRVTEAFLESEFKILGPDLFAREYLCVWDPLPAARGDAKIDEVGWRDCVDVASQIVGPVVLTVDTEFDQSYSSVTVCGRNAGGIRQVEVVEELAGTAWIETLIAAKVGRNPDITTVAVDASGPSRALVTMLERVTNTLGVDLVKLTGAEYAGACASIVAAVPEHIAHRGDARLTNPALSTGARKYGTQDGWIWDRRSGHITTLVAGTVAFAVAAGLPDSAPRSAYEDHGVEFV